MYQNLLMNKSSHERTTCHGKILQTVGVIQFIVYQMRRINNTDDNHNNYRNTNNSVYYINRCSRTISIRKKKMKAKETINRENSIADNAGNIRCKLLTPWREFLLVFFPYKYNTLQGINISHLGKRKIIFKMLFLGDMLVSWRVYQIRFRLQPVL